MRVLLLDIGGVFYRDWPGDSFWPAWSERTGLTREQLEAFLDSDPDFRLASIGQISAEDACQRAGKRLGIGADVIHTLRVEAFLSEPNEPLAAFVRDLRQRGVPVSALSNSSSPAAEVAERALTRGLFDVIISSHDVGARKPDPRMFDAALSALGRSAGEIVFVDDVAAHVEAARGLGFEAFQFRSTDDAVARMARYWPD